MRQAETLRGIGVLSCAAFSPSGLETGAFHELGQDNTVLGLHPVLRKALTVVWGRVETILRMFDRYDPVYWTPALRHARHKLRHLKPDLIVSNDQSTLPLAFAIAGPRTRILFDAHEYHPGQHREEGKRSSFQKRSSIQLCRTLMPKADHCLTVSDAVADAYLELTGVRPTVLTNAPRYEDRMPVLTTSDRIRLVHHGGVFPQRGTIDFMELMDRLGPGYELHMYMVGRGTPDHERLERSANERNNVFLHPPVAPADLPATISQYDIGIHRLPPGVANYEYALPNKLFDFIQARLAVVVSPSKAMGELVRANGLGVVAARNDMEAMADAIRSITRDDIVRFKSRAHEKAFELSSAGNMELLERIATGLLTTEE